MSGAAQRVPKFSDVRELMMLLANLLETAQQLSPGPERTAARSGAWRPVNPIDGDHHFRLMTTTCSGRWRPGQQGCGRA